MKTMYALIALSLALTGCASGPSLGAIHAFCDNSGYEPGSRAYGQCVHQATVEERELRNAMNSARTQPVWYTDGGLGNPEDARCTTTVSANGDYATVCTDEQNAASSAQFIDLELGIEDLELHNQT